MMNAEVHSDGQSSAISRNVRLQNSLHIPGGCLNQFHSGNFASSRPTPTGVICFVIECERLQPDYARADEYACARTESGGSRRSGNDRKPLFRSVMWTVRESQKNLREAEERIMDSRDWG